MTACASSTPEGTRSVHAKSHDKWATRLVRHLAVRELAGLVGTRAETEKGVAAVLAGRLSTLTLLAPLYAHMDGPHAQTYFLQMEVPDRWGPIKIGSSSAPLRRRFEIGCASPYPILLLTSYPGEILHELTLHRVFKRTRMRGEWFEPTPRLLSLIRTVQRLAVADKALETDGHPRLAPRHGVCP